MEITVIIVKRNRGAVISRSPHPFLYFVMYQLLPLQIYDGLSENTFLFSDYTKSDVGRHL